MISDKNKINKYIYFEFSLPSIIVFMIQKSQFDIKCHV